MFLLDTNVVSELRKVRSGKANPHVARWSDAVDAGGTSAHITGPKEWQAKIGKIPVATI